jgi:hypothetical protein
VNKPGSNAVYVVVAVVVALAASAQGAPLHSASTLLAFTAAQLTLIFDSEGGNFSSTSQPGTLLALRNASSPSLKFEDAPNTKLPNATTVHVAIPADSEAMGEMHWASGKVLDLSRYFTPASVSISSGADILCAPLMGHLCAPSGQNAKYRFAYLKRDRVYVRSKS